MRPLSALLALAAALPGAEFDITSAGYLGDAAHDDEVVGVAIQSDGGIVVAAKAGPATPALADALLLPGASPASAGVVLVLTPDGRRVRLAARLPAEPLDIALDGGDGIYVALGAGGGIALDGRTLARRWSVDAPVDPRDAARVGAIHRVDAAGDDVAFLAGAYGVTAREALDASPGQGLVLVWTATGAETARFATLGGRNANDLAFHPATRTLVVAGWRQTNDWWISGSVGGPVQIPVLHGLTYDGRTRWVGYDWGVDPDQVATYLNRNGLFPDGTKNGNATAGNNMADARLYRVALGGDGAMVVTGHSAGGNHLYRFAATDVSDPVQGAHPAVTDVGPHGFVVRAKTDETGRAFFAVLPDGAPAPTAAQVRAGRDAADLALPAGRVGSFDLVAGAAGSSSEVAGLPPSTAWDVHIVAEDDGGMLSTRVKRDVTTAAIVWSDPSDAEGATAFLRTGPATTRFQTALTAPGSVAWVVLPAGSAAPSAAQVAAGRDAAGTLVESGRRGTVPCPVRGRRGEAAIALDAGSAWELHAIPRDPGGQVAGSTPLVRSLGAVTAPPALSRAAAEDRFNSGFTAAIQAGAPATVWCVVVPDGAPAPGAARIRAGQDASGAAAPAAGSATGEGVLRCEIAGLARATAYDVWWTAEGHAAGMLTTPVRLDAATTDDDAPPVWSSSEQPQVVDSSTAALTVQVRLNERGTVHWVRLPAGAPAPGPAQVAAGRDAAGAAVPGGSRAVGTGTVRLTVDGLAPGTGFRIALVAEDRNGLRQGGTVVVDGRTLDAAGGGWVTPPTVDRIGTRSAVLRFKNGTGGTGHWLVRPAADPAPGIDEVRAAPGTAFTWKLPAMAALRGLSPGTAYRAWVLAVDGDGVATGPSSVAFTTATEDVRPPAWAPAALSDYDSFTSYAGASSQHLGFAGRYDISRDHPVFAGGQGVVARLDVITPNTLHAEGGGVAGGASGTLMVAGLSAYGLPFWPTDVDWERRSDAAFNPFGFDDYTGGAFLIGLRWGSTNPAAPEERWFHRRAYTTRLAYGRSRAVAMRVVDGVERVVWGGRVDLADGPMHVVGNPVQATPGYGARDGFLVVHVPGDDGSAGTGGGVSRALAVPITGPLGGGGEGATIRLRNRQAPDTLATDHDGDGQADDLRFLLPWSLTDPLLPATGTGAAYAGPLIYGGVVVDILNNQVSGRTLDAMQAVANGGARTLRLLLKEGLDAANPGERIRSRVAFLLKAEDLRDPDGQPLKGPSDRLSFDTSSEFSFTLRKGASRWKDYDGATSGAPAVDLAIRFLVRDGGQLYVSRDVRNWEGRGTSEWSTHVLAFNADSSDGEWAPWSPVPGQPAIFDAAGAVFATMDFQDVTAVGWYAEDTGWRRHYQDPVRWWNSNDNQNGIFYEWDGITARFARNASTNRPPVAAFSIRDSSMAADDLVVRAGDPIVVDGRASSDPEGRLGFLTWAFGDGGESSGSTATHAYAAAGRYPVTLTAWDDQRVRTSLTRHVTVVRGDMVQAAATGTIAAWSGHPADGGAFLRPEDADYRRSGIDADGDGSADDTRLERPFAGIGAPLTPPGWDGTRLVGAWRAERRDSAAWAIGDPGMAECGTNSGDIGPWSVNGIHLRGYGFGFQGGAVGRAWALIAIDKADFLHGTHDPAVRVAFAADSLLSAGPVHTMSPATAMGGALRFAVRDGGQWYVSAATFSTTRAHAANLNNGGYLGNPVFRLADPGAAAWAAFDPATRLDPPDAGYAVRSFTDITAVGAVLDVDDGAGGFVTLPAGTAGGIRLAGLEFQARSDLAARPAPSAAFTVAPDAGSAPLAVVADAGASGGGLARTYAWDFGDGVTAAATGAATARHIYGAPGVYRAVLTVTDILGRSSTASRTVTVAGTPPTIRLLTAAVTGDEGSSAVLRLERSGSPAGTVSVRLRSRDGTARLANPGGQGPDYAAVDDRVTWASGELGERSFAVALNADSTADPGESLAIEVSDPYNGAVIDGPAAAAITITDAAPRPPVITTPPAGRTVREGSILRLAVGASGAELAYRWRRDGVDLGDGTTAAGSTISQSGTAEVRIAGIMPGDAGRYDCRVSNLAGTVVSTGAAIVVDARPAVAITSPATGRLILPDPGDRLALAADATDPEGSVLGAAWTLVSGPAGGTADFADAATTATSVAFTLPGTYVLRCTVDDGGLTAHDELTVHAGAAWAEGVAGPLRTTSSGVPVSGSAAVAGGSATVASSWTQLPAGINGWFRHALVGGDFTVTVRVGSADQVPQQWAQYGILATADAAMPATAAFAFMGTYAGQGAVAQVRPFTGGAVVSQRSGGGPWFRLTRRGDLFTGFRSADGVAWTQQMDAVVVPMGQAVRLGLVVNAHTNAGTVGAADAARRMTVVWDRVEGLPDAGAAPDVGLAATRTVAAGVRFTATGTVVDDGGVPALRWLRVSGPGTASISAPTSASTRVLLAQAGTHVLRLQADDGTARVHRDQTVTAGLPPVITTSALPVVRVGDPVSIVLAADHLPTAWTASGLPEGLAISAADGRLAGAPATVGAFTVTATAANALGSGSRTWLLVVEDLPDLPPAITDVLPADARTGSVVAIQGGAFARGATVRIGGVDATTAWISTSRLETVVPAGLAGPVAVVVANGSATAAWAGRLRVDDIPPPRPAPAAVAGDGTPAPRLSGTATEAVAVAVIVGGVERVRLTLVTGFAWAWTADLPVGIHAVTIRAYDAAGNASPVSEAATISVVAAVPPPGPGGSGGGGGGCGLGAGLGLLLAGLFLAWRRRPAALTDRG